MSARPGNWSLLDADGDPFPGDVHEVHLQAAGYRDVAAEIRDQIRRLRGMADGTDDLVGKYAPALRDAAEDLAGELAKAQGRFDTVAEQLARWEPVLEEGQRVTGNLLRQAEDAQQRIEDNAPSPGPGPADPTDAELAAERARAARYDQASDELRALVQEFHAEVDHARSVARDVAAKIDDASHDQLKDSWWDSHVRLWIHDHASLLKEIADVLTFAATIIAVVVLAATPAGWLATAAFFAVIAAGTGALAIHTALAANGDGSWVDVAIDVVAVLTAGTGRALATAAEVERGVQLTESAAEVGQAAFDETAVTSRLFVAGEDGVRVVTRLDNVSETVEAWESAYTKVLSREVKEVGLVERLAGGDTAALTGDLRAMAREFGETPLIEDALRASTTATRLYQVGTAADVVFKILNDATLGPLHYPGIRPWVRWKEEHTVVGLPDAWEKLLFLGPTGLLVP